MLKLRVIAVCMLTATVAYAQPAAKKAPTAAGGKIGRGVGVGSMRKAGKPVVPQDVAALNGPDVEAAAKAAESLGANDGAAAKDALLEALALGMPAEVAVPAIRSVALHPEATDVPTLLRYANHINPTVRDAAITALGAYSQKEAQDKIIERIGDSVQIVRATASATASKAKIKSAIDPMMVLLARGEEGPAHALAAMADPDLARRIADQLGKVPDATLAMCLGEILVRADFGPDTARVEVVRAIGKIQDESAVHALVDYVSSTPKTDKSTAKTEAQGIIKARGGQ
ncbi:MAG TPA: HEAT repeat domain-containing protein [Kofleriaceae bacterium]|jgi:HEAT repeat protein